MKLLPLKDILKSTKEQVDSLLAGPREKYLKAKAESKMAEIEMEIEKINNDIQEQFSDKDLVKNFNFDTLMDKLDKAELLDGRLSQYKDVLVQLFPAPEVKS